MGGQTHLAAVGTQSVPVFVARQAIFDPSLNVFAHELLFRSCANGPARVDNDSSATASVIANGLALVESQLQAGPVFINFSGDLLLQGAPLALRSETCVIEILETVTPTPKLLRALKEYKDQGYILALDDYVGQPDLAPFVELADIIKVEVMDRSLAQIISIGQKLRAPGRKLLAEKVENNTVFELCSSLGFDYFQGYHFSRPVVEQGTALQTGQVTRLRVLKEISSQDYHVNKVAKTISQDSGLSYRLLKHLNSPHFGFSQKVNSLTQAVTLMGGKPLKQWLMLVMMADMGDGGRHDELVFTSVRRGNFLERLAVQKPLPPYLPDTFFLLGLFSNLDALLHKPMSEIIPHLPFDETVAAALLGEPNLVRQYLELGILLETAQWEAAEKLIGDMQLPQEQVASLHAKAATWAFTMLAFDKN